MGMSFSWIDYYKVGQKLYQEAESELSTAMLRTSISRTYYSVYHSSKMFLQSIGKYEPNMSERSHEGVINIFRNSREKGHNRIAASLDRLRHQRTRADYSSSNYNYKYEAEAALSGGLTTLKFLKSLGLDLPQLEDE
jgi:uncharacterized protein (UPF0332 family)